MKSKIFVFLAIICFFTFDVNSHLFAQNNSWVFDGPAGSQITHLAYNPNSGVLYANDYWQGPQQTLNGISNNSRWSATNQQLAGLLSSIGLVVKMQVDAQNNNLYVIADSGGTQVLRLSLDQPDLGWLPLSGQQALGPLQAMTMSQNKVYVASSLGVFESPLQGNPVWTNIKAGLPENKNITSLLIQDNFIYATVNLDEIYRKNLANNNAWAIYGNTGNMVPEPNLNQILAVNSGGLTLIALDSYQVVKLQFVQGNPQWVSILTPEQDNPFRSVANNYIRSAAVYRNKLYVAASRGVYFKDLTTNDPWAILANSDAVLNQVNVIKVVDNRLIAGTMDDGVWQKNLDDLSVWSRVGTGANLPLEAYSYAKHGNYLYVATYHGIFRKDFRVGNAVWNAFNEGLNDRGTMQIQVEGNIAYARNRRGHWTRNLADQAAVWTQLPMFNTLADENFYFNPFQIVANKMYVLASGQRSEGGIFSRDLNNPNVPWQLLMAHPTYMGNQRDPLVALIKQFIVHENKIYVTTQQMGALKKNLVGGAWEPIAPIARMPDPVIKSLSLQEGVLFALTQEGWVYANSMAAGSAWMLIAQLNDQLADVLKVANDFYVSAAGIYLRNLANDAAWQTIKDSVSTKKMIIAGNYLFVSTPQGIYHVALSDEAAPPPPPLPPPAGVDLVDIRPILPPNFVFPEIADDAADDAGANPDNRLPVPPELADGGDIDVPPLVPPAPNSSGGCQLANSGPVASVHMLCLLLGLVQLIWLRRTKRS